MTAKEARFPSQYAATSPQQEAQPLVNRIKLANGELLIEQTSKKVTKYVVDYSKNIYFNSATGDKDTIYSEHKYLAKRNIPIFIKT